MSRIRKGYYRSNAKLHTSKCCDVIVRGSAQSLVEKYNMLAAEDPVNREMYLQHADHYNRVLNSEQLRGEGL